MDTDIKTLAVLVAMHRREPMQRGQIVFDAAQLLGPANAGDPRVLGRTLDSLVDIGAVYRRRLGLYHLTLKGEESARTGVRWIEAALSRFTCRMLA